MLPLKHEGAFEEAKKIQKAIEKNGFTRSHTLEGSKFIPFSDPETIEGLSEKLKKRANEKK